MVVWEIATCGSQRDIAHNIQVTPDECDLYWERSLIYPPHSSLSGGNQQRNFQESQPTVKMEHLNVTCNSFRACAMSVWYRVRRSSAAKKFSAYRFLAATENENAALKCRTQDK
jgi:hypothetical protein